jgi:hypothetical protein
VTSQKKAILQMAQELYLTLKEDGTKKYTLQDMQSILHKKFKSGPDYTTLSRWAKKHNWDALIQAAKNLGMRTAMKATPDMVNQTREESIIEAMADDIAKRRGMALAKKDLADYLIIEAMKAEAEAVKSGAKKPEKIGIDLRVLQQIAKGEEDIIENLDGARPKTGGDKLDDILARLDNL